MLGISGKSTPYPNQGKYQCAKLIGVMSTKKAGDSSKQILDCWEKPGLGEGVRFCRVPFLGKKENESRFPGKWITYPDQPIMVVRKETPRCQDRDTLLCDHFASRNRQEVKTRRGAGGHAYLQRI
ncbi:hypothetical protein COP2_034946 [Malus domestica]